MCLKNCSKSDVASFLLRIVLAVVFAYHAVSKLQGGWANTPALMQFTAVAETLGAIGLLVRCTVRWAAIGLCLVMVGALYHHFFIWNQGYGKAELAIITLASLITIVLNGSGKCGLGCRMCDTCKGDAPSTPTQSM